MDVIREQVQQLVSLPMWSCLLPVSLLAVLPFLFKNYALKTIL